MNGQTTKFDIKKYKESCRLTGEPVAAPRIDIDLRALKRYAEKKGLKIKQLSQEEKMQFARKY